MNADPNIDLLARLDLDSLLQTRAKAAAAGDLATANKLHAAIEVRSQSYEPSLFTSGKLFRHDEQEMRDGLPTGRWLRRWTGDPMTWMAPYMRPGASGKLNRKMIDEAKHGKLESVRVPQGHKVQIVKA